MPDPRSIRREPQTFPTIRATQLGRHRREAIEELVREAHERELRGQALRVWSYRVRALLGSDFTLDVLLRLADRRP